MNREELLARIAELSKLRDNALANANALGGAIQDCEFWLQRIEAQEREPGGRTPTQEGT